MKIIMEHTENSAPFGSDLSAECLGWQSDARIIMTVVKNISSVQMLSKRTISRHLVYNVYHPRIIFSLVYVVYFSWCHQIKVVSHEKTIEIHLLTWLWNFLYVFFSFNWVRFSHDLFLFFPTFFIAFYLQCLQFI